MPTDPITDLETEVAEEATVMASATALINGFKDRLDTAVADARKGDFASLAKLQTDLDTQGTALAAAVSANTPAAPTP